MKHLNLAFACLLAMAAALSAHAGTYSIVANPLLERSALNVPFVLVPPTEPPITAMFTLANGDTTSSGTITNYQESYLNETLASGNAITLDRWAVQSNQFAAYILAFRTSPLASNFIVSAVLSKPDGTSKALPLSCGWLATNQYVCDGVFGFPTARCSYSMHAVPGSYTIDFTHQNGAVTRFNLPVTQQSDPGC